MHKINREENIIYQKQIESNISKYIELSNSFTELCRLVQGPTPIEIVSSVRNKPNLRKKLSELIEKDNSQVLSPDEQFIFKGNPLPEPLIIDSDWRYTTECAESVVKIARLTTNKKAVCLGSPTIFASLLNQNIQALMIDRNSLVCDFFKRNDVHDVICSDIHQLNITSFIKQFDCVFLDPPWYLNQYYRWLSIATAQCTRDGSIYLPIFSEFLRPKARKEIAELHEVLASLNYEAEIVTSLDYVVPSYERAVFKHHGLKKTGNWRTASLLRLGISSVDRNSAIKTLMAKVLPPTKLKTWRRFELDGKSYAIDDGIIKNEAHYQGKIGFLESVSARSNNFGKYNFVDSENNVSFIEELQHDVNQHEMNSCTAFDSGNICINFDNESGVVHAGYYNSTLS